MKSKLTSAMTGALTALAKKNNLTYADLVVAGGSGSSLANLVTHGLAVRTDKGGEKTWSITPLGREARKSGLYDKIVTDSPKSTPSKASRIETSAPAKATASKGKAPAKPAAKRKLAGAR